MPIRLVVTDMDNTLYSWVDYIVPAVEAMVSAVQLATGHPRIRVVQSLKEVYGRYESNEYPFVLQESSIYRDFPEFASFHALVIDPAKAAFGDARRKYMRPYKGVLDTLDALASRGIPVVALTDAPRNPAEGRLKQLRLESRLAAVYTMPAFTFPVEPDGTFRVASYIAEKETAGEYRAKCDVVELPREFEKPHTGGLLQILERFGVSPHETLVVGDSLNKDVRVARDAGCVDCWAEYGTYISLEYRERLEVISSPAITRRHANSVNERGRDSAIKPTHALSNFAQVLERVDALA